jgi:hypothetical protein
MFHIAVVVDDDEDDDFVVVVAVVVVVVVVGKNLFLNLCRCLWKQLVAHYTNSLHTLTLQ